MIYVYLHPRGEKGELLLDPPGGEMPSEFEQFRRFCAHRGVTDPRTVANRFREWKGKRDGTRAAGSTDADPGESA